MSIRVLLVDDHKLMIAGLRALLARVPDIEIVGQASDGREALDLVRTRPPDVVVMDIKLPELDGVEATRRIRAEFEDVKVLALSAYADRHQVHDMLVAGACGFVLKTAAHEDLVRAVRAAHLGKTYLSPEITGPVVERSNSGLSGGDESPETTLCAREREVLQLVADGMTSAGAAQALHISVKTVESHRRNIARKLGLRGTAELTRYALREGLISLQE